MDLKETTLLGDKVDTHWYYWSKSRAVRSILGTIRVPEVLDIGAGSDFFSRDLIRSGICKNAVCVDTLYPQERQEYVNGGSVTFCKHVDRVSQRLILMMDVIEHVDDDLELIRTYTEPLPMGSYLLVSVPAFSFLWSGHDVFLEHRRRYTLGELESRLASVGVLSRY